MEFVSPLQRAAKALGADAGIEVGESLVEGGGGDRDGVIAHAVERRRLLAQRGLGGVDHVGDRGSGRGRRLALAAALKEHGRLARENPGDEARLVASPLDAASAPERVPCAHS